MQNDLKVVALIARKSRARVEKLISQGRNTTIVSRLVPRGAHYRRKSLPLPSDGDVQQTRLVRHDVQTGLEKLRESVLFEYGPNVNWTFGADGLDIVTPWIEGSTIADRPSVDSAHPTGYGASFSLDDPRALQARLRIWVRLFERLAQWHAQGVIHGNVKPGNLLVCDPLPPSITDRSPSEFFERKDNVPHVGLLDGAYAHLLQSGRRDSHFAERTSTEEAHGTRWHDGFWLPPESLGVSEGCYREAGDIFSLAACMAWDLGLMSPEPNLRAGLVAMGALPAAGEEDAGVQSTPLTYPSSGAAAGMHFGDFSSEGTRHAHTALGHLWPLFVSGDARLFHHSGAWLQWSNRNPVVETVRKLRSLLVRALHPSPDRRVKTAREVAFEIMVMSARLSEAAKEEKLDPQVTRLERSTQAEWSEFAANCTRALCKGFETPEMPRAGVVRTWYIAKNRDTNTQGTLRRATAALTALEGRVAYFRVRHDDKEFPFSALNRFVGAVLGETLRHNPAALGNRQAFFKGLTGKARLLVQVLPALRHFFGDLGRESDKRSELAIHARHEALHSAARKLVLHLLTTSRLSTIAIDDLHRADASSLEILLDVMTAPHAPCRYLIGTRAFEKNATPSLQRALENLRERDASVDVLLGPRTSTLSGRVASLRPDMARLLAAWTTLGAPFTFEDIEFLSARSAAVPGLLSTDYHGGKRAWPNRKGRDVGANAEMDEDEGLTPDAASQAALAYAAAPRDDVLLAMETLQCARELGLLSEMRDATSGRLVGFVWASDRISLTLSLLLTHDVRRELALMLSARHPEDVLEHNAWDTVLRMAERFVESDLSCTAHAAFAAYVRAAESIPDLPSARYLVSRFTRLQERLERQKTPDADSLVPRIRETLADLSKALGDFETATRYYDAVGWNTANPKRKAILQLKSFFPSRAPTRESRELWFDSIVRAGVEAELLPSIERPEGLDPNLLAIHELRRLEILMEKETLLGGTVTEGVVPLRALVALTLKPGESRAERLPYMARSRAIRETTYSGFLRTAVGWVGASRLFPELIRSLALAVRAEDGESILASLFSLYITGGRQLRGDVRALLLDLATDVATRLGDEMEIAEAIALRAFGAYFFEGNLEECRRSIDMLQAARRDLPSPVRQVAARLGFLCTLEEEAIETAKLPAIRGEELLRHMHATGIGGWELGAALVDGRFVEKPLSARPDAGLIADLLLEQMDQVLMYQLLSTEQANAAAAHTVCARARAVGQREWLADGISSLAYMPESVAKHWFAQESRRGQRSRGLDPLFSGEFEVLEKTFVPQRRVPVAPYDLDKKSLPRTVQAWVSRMVLGDVVPRKAEESVDAPRRTAPSLSAGRGWGGKNWSQDLALEAGLRFERAASQDPQRLTALARACCNARYLWLGARIAARAGVDLIDLVREEGIDWQRTRDGTKTHGSHGRRSFDAQANDIGFASALGSLQTTGSLESMGPLANRGSRGGAVFSDPLAAGGSGHTTVALNYILEFLHNLQRNVLENDGVTPEQVALLAQCLLKSIPVHTELTETLVADALRTASRRLGGLSDVPSGRKPGTLAPASEDASGKPLRLAG